MRRMTGVAAAAALLLVAACDDGRMDGLPGGEPTEVPEAQTPWDTLHPPVPDPEPLPPDAPVQPPPAQPGQPQPGQPQPPAR